MSSSSIHSTSSTSTSSKSTPFRLTYAKDGQGHDFTASYKYGTSPNAVTTKSIDRLVYAKDARGQTLASYPFESITETEERLLASKPDLIVGDDGLFRGPYDHGQRERTLSYWAELRSGASSLRQSSIFSRRS